MKYIFNGIEYTELPNPLKLADGSTLSPMNATLFEQLGGEIVDDGVPTREQEFQSACADFRTVCGAIGQFLGIDNFHGGFGEMASFASSDAYQANPVLGNTLAIQWSAMNESCKYFGSKIGLGQPDWWYKCWEETE